MPPWSAQRSRFVPSSIYQVPRQKVFSIAKLKAHIHSFLMAHNFVKRRFAIARRSNGAASSLYAPTLNHHSNIVPLGPMLAVFEAIGGTPQR
jgi:uncharacterized protein YigE (DUF2233 family)